LWIEAKVKDKIIIKTDQRSQSNKSQSRLRDGIPAYWVRKTKENNLVKWKRLCKYRGDPREDKEENFRFYEVEVEDTKGEFEACEQK